jgi:SDR family mycofactocin-dependent oxidoreductase
MTQRLEGKVAFITGAARGQGRSHAIRLAEAGADIIAVDLAGPIDSIRDLYPAATDSDLAETVAAVEALDRRIVAVKADVRDIEPLADAVDRGVSQFGRLDIVCANAGIFDFGVLTHEVSEASWSDVIDVNLTGVFHTVKAAVPHILAGRRGGSIVLISSTAGLKGAYSLVAYSASKHALQGMMRTLALELGPSSIRVNTVHPGHVATDMIFNQRMNRAFVPGVENPELEQVAAAFARTNVLPIPWVEPIDVSNALLFLASDDSRYITGTELKVDAGFTLK